jgi:plasmid stabilization system protein ParE
MKKRLDWSRRAQADIERIVAYYAESASSSVAKMARNAIQTAADRLVSLPVLYREGKGSTREYVMRRFPYVIVYRSLSREVRIVRVLHQAGRYFNQ